MRSTILSHLMKLWVEGDDNEDDNAHQNSPPERTNYKAPDCRKTILLCVVLICALMNLVRAPTLSECIDTNIVYHSGGIKEDEVMSSSRVVNHTESIDASNMHYTWIGNQWVPPNGVPVYSAAKMQAVYERYNIVWIGDSTARRAYMTLRGILNAPNPSDVSISEIDAAAVIDHGKMGNFGGNCTKYVDFPWSNNTSALKKCTGTMGNSKMDIFNPGISCFSSVQDFASTYLEYGKKTSQDYDVLIIAMGIWEIIRTRDCAKGSNETDGGKRLQLALKSLRDLASPKFRIIWRTMGFSEKHSNTKGTINIYNHIAKEFIEAQPYMSYVDWGGEIEQRLFGSSKIKGDLSPHYGLQARTLLTNMLTHEIASLKQNRLVSH